MKVVPEDVSTHCSISVYHTRAPQSTAVRLSKHRYTVTPDNSRGQVGMGRDQLPTASQVLQGIRIRLGKLCSQGHRCRWLSVNIYWAVHACI